MSSVKPLAILIVGVVGLVALGFVNYFDGAASTNLIWLTFLALCCAMVVAALPGSADLRIGNWITATGSVAVFIFIFYKVYDYSLAHLQSKTEALENSVKALQATGIPEFEYVESKGKINSGGASVNLSLACPSSKTGIGLDPIYEGPIKLLVTERGSTWKLRITNLQGSHRDELDYSIRLICVRTRSIEVR